MNKIMNFITEKNICSIVLGALIITIVLTDVSLAQSPNFSGIESFLNAIVNAVTGPIGVAIASLAVMGVGFSFMTGHMDWTYAAAVVLGIAVVFGGATLVGGLTKL